MGVGVETPMQPTSGLHVMNGTASYDLKVQSLGNMGTSSASAASTHSPAEPVDRRNGDPEGLNGLDSSRDSITVDVESTGEGKTSMSAADELRTPLNNVTNTPTGGIKVEDVAADWSEYFLGDMPLHQWLLAVKKYVLAPLIRHPRSLAFRKPVDPVALGIYPIYNQIITRPMDLGTIKTKVDKKLYNSKDGVLNDINLVWNNAIKFNPIGHVVHEAALFLQKHTRDHCLKSMVTNDGHLGTPPNGAKKPSDSSFPTPMRPAGLREVRKKAPLGLPGEYDDLKPQHLEQKYASKLSEPLKACDGILRNLMLQSQHKDYVEPFMKPQQSGAMCFGLIKDRLRSYHYTTSLEFANDMRRIVTETYRAANDPETDFRSSKARKLQTEFERQYALVNTYNEGSFDEACKAWAQNDPHIAKLVDAKNLVNRIQSEVSLLVKDYEDIKESIKSHKREMRQQRCAKSSATATPTKRKNATSPNKPPAKRQKTERKPKESQSAVNELSKKPTAEQLGEWISMLDDDRQESLLEILRRNGEKIEVGADGSVELSLEVWTQKTLDDVELFLRRQIPTGPSAATASKAGAGSKKGTKRTEVSSSESDSSSSGDSSSSDSSDED